MAAVQQSGWSDAKRGGMEQTMETGVAERTEPPIKTQIHVPAGIGLDQEKSDLNMTRVLKTRGDETLLENVRVGLFGRTNSFPLYVQNTGAFLTRVSVSKYTDSALCGGGTLVGPSFDFPVVTCLSEPRIQPAAGAKQIFHPLLRGAIHNVARSRVYDRRRVL